MNQSEPEWEMIEVTTWGDSKPRYIRGRCLHNRMMPVESVVDGTVLAHLCLTCDAQLPVEMVSVGAGS